MIAKLRNGFAEAWQERVERAKDFWLRGGWKEALRDWWNTPGHAPYWRQPLEHEDTVPIPVVPRDLFWDVNKIILLGLFMCIGLLTPLAYINAIVFAYPGGFVRLTGEFLAQVCLRTGSCDFGYLMAGLAFALQILLMAFVLITISLRPGRQEIVTEDDGVSESETEGYDHEHLDRRIVVLRDDLVKAGVLKAEPLEDKWREDD